MDCQTLYARLDTELRTDAYAAVDASANGLQVGTTAGEIERAAFAVDAAAETIERASAADADVLIVHHGLSWGGIERVTGQTYDRIAALVDADIALYVSHLPLDGHPELGNAAGVADVLGLEQRDPFGAVGGEHAGQQGVLPTPTDIAGLREQLTPALDTGEGAVQTLAFGPASIERVAVLTGSGADWLEAAATAGADVMITGEGKQKLYHQAREAGIHVLLGGHYATETFGVRSLASLVADWGVETTVIDCPTGL